MIQRIRQNARDYLQYLKEREIGPLVVVTEKQFQSHSKNAFKLGRDYERGGVARS